MRKHVFTPYFSKFRSFGKLNPTKLHVVLENLVMKRIFCLSSAFVKSALKTVIPPELSNVCVLFSK